MRVRWVTLAVVVAASATLASATLYPIVVKLRRRSRQSRPDGIEHISKPTNPKFDIVAVHGLGAHPEHTWSCKAPAEAAHSDKVPRIHLLRDLLKPDFPEARILSFAYNSDWFINAPVKTAQQIAYRLLEQLKKARSKDCCIPIIFIGHSFGGIIIKEALCKAGDDSRDIFDKTCGIIFLGTPHQGSPVSVAGASAALLTGFLGSDTTLLFTLRHYEKQLSDLESRFRGCLVQKEDRRQKTGIVSFHETRPTRLLGWLSIGLIVTPDSARGCALETIDIDADHSGLNKCSRREDKLYQELKCVLDRLRPTDKPTLNNNQKYVVEKLEAIKGAAFDSYAEEREAECHPGTRVDILRQIDEWANSVEGKCIFWLQGRAGTGKSTISRTVASKLARSGRLGASFFFKRGQGERGKASRFFITIAAQIVQQLPSMAEYMRNAIEADPSVAEKTKKEQFEKLILEPLGKVDDGPETPSMTMVVVIDALDECNQEKDVTDIISLLLEAKQLPSIQLKFFVTSRPEVHIRDRFNDTSDLYANVALHKVPVSEIKHDISLFLRFRLETFRDELNRRKIPESLKLPADWPSQEKLEKLVKMAIPLFIFATTACRFIEDQRHSGSPSDRLEKILEYQTRDHESNLDATYFPALDQMLLGLKDSARCNSIQEFKQVVGSIVVLASPLSADSLATLLGISREVVHQRLNLLHSVLNVPSDQYAPVTLFHLSFRDFLVDSDKRAKEFWVDENNIHKELASRCLDLLSNKLTKDICSLRKPGTLRKNIGKELIDRNLPPELQYACLYWVDHLCEIKSSHDEVVLYDNGTIDVFLRKHFLHWLEALSLIKGISDGVLAIAKLVGLFKRVSSESQLLHLVQDMHRFILSSRYVIENTPLQAYSSALLFSPVHCLTRELFQDEEPDWITKKPAMEADWGACIQTLYDYNDGVNSVAFSHNGTQVVSGSDDDTVRIWDTSSGACLKTLEGHRDSVYSVAFSHDSTQVVSGSGDDTVRIWDTSSGACLKTLEGHRDSVYSVAFSHDSTQVVSGSGDDTVRIWDTSSGACLKTLEGHRDSVYSVAFSHDSTQVVSGSHDRTIKIWDISSNTCLKTLEGHSNLVYSVAFSYNGMQVVSGSADNKVKIWDTSSGACLKTLEGHNNFVKSVAFSHNSTQVVSGSLDKTVKIWDASSGPCLKTLDDHSDWVSSVAFSHNGTQVVSGSADGTVKIWDVSSGACLKTLGHSSRVNLVAFSHDDTQIVSGSDYSTVKIWDVSSGDCLKTLKWRYNKTAYEIAFGSNRALATTTLEEPRHSYGLDSDREWITYNGQNVLFLPLEYRLLCSAVMRNTISIGCRTGRVLIISFSFNKSPLE